ncbi:MAG: DNA polymerase I [Armatimonadetes bacterium]|nr:DNA polymerase I [Armatimonadota bacterium]
MSSPQEKTCLIVDGNSLLYRAFYAVKYLSTRQGQPTNALYGFATMLLRLLGQVSPQAFIVAFDAPAKTFRHEVYEEYKGTRKETPDELISQVGIARDLARALGALVLEQPGYEADDIVGTCATRAEQTGYEVLIVTGDLDELQLVSDHIRVATTTRGVSDVTVYTPEAVEERYGLHPRQFVDYKALKGDASDNIPGVPGIGDKTASRLVQQYGSVEELLARLDDLPPSKVKDSLENSRDQLAMSKMLATIITDMPLDVDISELPSSSRMPGEAEQLFRSLEFETLLKRLPGASAPPEATGVAQSQSLPPVHLIPSEPDLRKMLLAIEGEEVVSFWIDADSDFRPVSFSFATDSACWAVAVRSESRAQSSLGDALDGSFSVQPQQFSDLFASLERPKATHDAKRAQLLLATCGVNLAACQDDTMLAGFLLQPGRGSYDLEWLAMQHLGLELPEDDALSRSARKAALVRLLRKVLRDRIDSESLQKVYADIELPLSPVLARMQQVGVGIDSDGLRALSQEMASEIASLERDIYELAGTEFSIGSPRQLGSVLFEKLQLPSGKRTKTGYSTDAQTLESLAGDFEIAARVLQWRELTKLKGAYADALPNLVDKTTGRIHTSLNQTGAATGRLSSSDPNLQNIPVRSELGRKIRASFVAAPGCELISADYSQIELRLLAHMSGDEELIRCYTAGEDIHVRTACALFGVVAADVSPEMRRRAKTINFSVIYGKSNFGLSRELGISVSEAQSYIEKYFAQYPRVKEFNERVLERARVEGYVSTLFGRKRWFPELHAGDRNVRANAERAAFNAPLQGTAADIIKLAMISLDKLFRDAKATMVLQVHDELVFDADKDAISEIVPVVKREMECVCHLAVPLVADVKCGLNWRDMQLCS